MASGAAATAARGWPLAPSSTTTSCGDGRTVHAVRPAMPLVLFHGAWLLVPFGVLAALLPYGRNRNYGLLAMFLTPLVMVLADLLKPAGWRLAGDRLVDTLIGCAIVLVVGFAPWPMSWYAHLPGSFPGQLFRRCRAGRI
jgi:hypothetical protein